MIYSFANCVMEYAPYLTHVQPSEKSIVNLRTEGILRLLNGETIRLCDRDRQTFFSSDDWKTFVEDHAHENRPRMDEYDVFDPIDVRSDDIFLWSPFADCFAKWSDATCPDGTPYPCSREPFIRVFEPRHKIPYTTTQEQWHELARRLDHVERKAVILYPPDRMDRTIADASSRDFHKAKVSFFNIEATSLFSAYGWKIFVPDAEIDEGQIWWSHYTHRSRKKLWDEIADAFGIPSDATSESKMRAEQLIF